jgi:hypothetical protein
MKWIHDYESLRIMTPFLSFVIHPKKETVIRLKVGRFTAGTWGTFQSYTQWLLASGRLIGFTKLGRL